MCIHKRIYYTNVHPIQGPRINQGKGLPCVTGVSETASEVHRVIWES